MLTMATLLAPDVKHEDWTEPRAMPGDPNWTRGEWLWTLAGIALLCVFLAFIVVDYPLRTLIAAR